MRDDLNAARLRWRCRRGIKEMDLLLERFLARGYPRLGAEGQSLFEHLLDEPDPDIYAWVTRQAEPDDHNYLAVINPLRKLMNEGFVTDLSSLALIEISGTDAVEFLHGQFTSDVVQLAPGKVALSAWCDPKGRTIATFILARLDDRCWLLIPDALKTALIQRLGMYVLRADVKIVDMGERLSRAGFVGVSADELMQLQPGLGINPGVPVVRHDEYTLVSYPDDITLVFAEPAKMQALRQTHGAGFPRADSRQWETANIRKGIPWLREKTSGLFIPQELNLDTLGALARDKGCYPGQEIIARLRFRSQVKRRLCYATTDNGTLLEPGAQLTAMGERKNIGAVVNSALDVKQELLIVLDRTFIEPGRIVAREFPGWPINVERETNPV